MRASASATRSTGGVARGVAWWQPAGFTALVLAYGLVHLVLRLALSTALTIDDSREAMFAQTLEWGYQARQPPLYNWLVWGAVRLFGVGVLALTVVKYAVLGAAYLFVYGSARRVLREPRLAALAACSLLLMVPLSWVVHETLTHSLVVLAAAAATFYALLRVEASGSRAAYAALGLTLALGFLSKFSFALFAGALLLAALTVDRFRARILHPRILWTAAIAVLLLLPFGLWFYQHDFSLGRLYREEVDPGEPDPWLPGVASALYYMARMTFYYLTPLWIVFLVLFPEAWRSKGADADAVPAHRLLERFFLAELGILLAGALLGGLAYLKFRWLMPAYFLFPLYFLSRLDVRAVGEARIRRFAAILLTAELVVVAAFVASIVRGDWLGRASHLNAPYRALGDQIAAAGFTGGTIAAGEGALAGNLKLRFPASRVIGIATRDYVPARRGDGQCLVVWEKERSETVPPELREWLAAVLGAPLPGDAPVRVAEARYDFARRQVHRVRYVLLPGGAGRCR